MARNSVLPLEVHTHKHTEQSNTLARTATNIHQTRPTQQASPSAALWWAHTNGRVLSDMNAIMHPGLGVSYGHFFLVSRARHSVHLHMYTPVYVCGTVRLYVCAHGGAP